MTEITPELIEQLTQMPIESIFDAIGFWNRDKYTRFMAQYEDSHLYKLFYELLDAKLRENGLTVIANYEGFFAVLDTQTNEFLGHHREAKNAFEEAMQTMAARIVEARRKHVSPETLALWNSPDTTKIFDTIEYFNGTRPVPLEDKASDINEIHTRRDILREWLEDRQIFITPALENAYAAIQVTNRVTHLGKYPTYDEALIAAVKTEIKNDR